MLTRRELLAGMAAPAAAALAPRIWTVRGAVAPSTLDTTLVHEHILVDFVGADQITPDRYVRADVVRAALPKLEALKQEGCRSFVDCTPAYLGRDPELLAELSRRTGLHILTNTGYYGAANDKYLPQHAFEETAAQLAARWIAEARDGIGTTGIRPAFVKLGVDGGDLLSSVDRKLIQAGAICHRETGLRLHVHTGPGITAMDCIEELRRSGVNPSAYVWVHAQAEKDLRMHVEAARAGAWIELDGINAKSAGQHLEALLNLREAGHLGHVLLSQDSGWYRVGEPGGGQFNGFTYLFQEFLPALRAKGLSGSEIRKLMNDNPERALTPGRQPT